jgi:hypothetical protein
LYDRAVNRRVVSYALLAAAATVRLLMQIDSMPPYAGLDELYHVARLAFVLEEHRNPTTTEPSVPAYLEATLERKWDALPSFALLQRDWHPQALHDRAITPGPYARPNYEAQQPSLYYSLVAPLARLAPRTALSELRLWRLASVVFALITILATATIGERWWGRSGLVAAALVAAMPTWETLVARASNDAFACALVAVALAITASERWIAAEAICWALAIAAKLYTWPLAIALPFFWRRQHASRWRVIAVVAACALAAALTFADLGARTRNPLGVVAFDRPGGAAVETHVNVVEIVKVTIASAAWTSGEHWDALRPAAIAAYLLPLLAAIVWASAARPSPFCLLLSGAVVLAFALAQALNVVSCVLARRAGNPVPIGGKEGWYWFVLVPIIVPALLAPAVKRFPLVAWWLIAWDIAITDAQLFRTWAGELSPDHPSFLFRWGPLRAPSLNPLRVAYAALVIVLQRSVRDA